ncbi:MAG: hypothetical protein NTV22_13490 [bacterium]|nr:hypothetical protein [bacterium]
MKKHIIVLLSITLACGFIVGFVLLRRATPPLQRHARSQGSHRSAHLPINNELVPQSTSTAIANVPQIDSALLREGSYAYNGTFSDDMLRYYFTNMVPTIQFLEHTQNSECISNSLWYAYTNGIRPPTNLIDYARFCIEAAAIYTGFPYILDILKHEATNGCYLNVWRAEVPKYYVPDYERHTWSTSDEVINTCMQLLLLNNAELQPNGYELIPTFTAVTNRNDLYETIMRDRKPEATPRFAYLDPAKYPQEARDWALNFPNSYTRYQQQSAWKGPRGTGQVAVVVLEEILKSWDTDPPYLWKNNPAYPVLDRRNMRMIIEEKKQSLAGAPK